MLALFNHSYPREVFLHYSLIRAVAPHTPFFVVTLILAHLITLTSFISFPFWPSELTGFTTHSRNPPFIHHSSVLSFQLLSSIFLSNITLLLSNLSLPNPDSTNTPHFSPLTKAPFSSRIPSWHHFLELIWVQHGICCRFKEGEHDFHQESASGYYHECILHGWAE